MRERAWHVALGTSAAIVCGLVAFLARGALLPAVDRLLDNVTLLRVAIALAVTAVLSILAGQWSQASLGDRLPAWRLSAAGASTVLGALVGSAAGIWSALNLRVTVPTVFSDELIYISLAKSLAHGDGPLVRGAETLGYGLAYPALLAPVYALADDGAQAYTAAQVTNAAVMASAAVPAYLLSRLVLARGDSLLVAALTVGTPLLSYTGYVMTESLFYPAFLWTAYAVATALARPTAAPQALALVALVGLCTVRPQAVVLLPAAATAVGLVAIRGPSPRAALRRYRILCAGLVTAALVGIAVHTLSSTSPVGAYAVLLTWPDPYELAVWSARELGGVMLAVGIVAVVVLPIAAVRMLGRTASDAERAVAATTVAFLLWMLVSVGVLDSSPFGLGWTHLRNLVPLVPLVLVPAFAWARGGMPRPAGPATLGVGLATVAALAVRASDLVHPGRFDAPSFLPWSAFATSDFPLDELLLICVALAAIVALTTRARWALPVSIVAAFLVIAPGVVPTTTPPWGVARERTTLLAALDREVGRGGDAIVVNALVQNPRCERRLLALATLWTEVLNSSAQAGNLFGGDLIEAQSTLAIGPDGTLLRDGRPVTARAVAIDPRIPIDGARVATIDIRDLGGELAEAPGSISVWRTNGRVVLTRPERAARAALELCPS